MSSMKLENLRKNIYQTYYSDGVWDIILGLTLLSFGLGVLINKNFWSLFPIIVALPLVLKRSISEQRIGTLKFKQSERRWLMVFYFGFILIVLGFVLLLGIINPSGVGIVSWLTLNLFMFIGLMIAIILGLAGRFIHFNRLIIYGIWIFICFAFAGRIITIGQALTGSGLLITISGMMVLRQFIKNHPKIILPEEATEEIA